MAIDEESVRNYCASCVTMLQPSFTALYFPVFVHGDILGESPAPYPAAT